MMSRKDVCVCVWCCCMKKSTASIQFSLRISLVSVSIVSSFMYTSTAYTLSSYHEPGTVIGLQIQSEWDVVVGETDNEKQTSKVETDEIMSNIIRSMKKVETRIVVESDFVWL